MTAAQRDGEVDEEYDADEVVVGTEQVERRRLERQHQQPHDDQ